MYRRGIREIGLMTRLLARGVRRILAAGLVVIALVATILYSSRGGATGDSPQGVTPRTMPGEWTGLAPEHGLLLTLRVDPEGQSAILAITEQQADRSLSTLYRVHKLVVDNGRFSVVAPSSGLRLEVDAKRTWGSGWGSGWLTLAAGSRSVRRLQVYFFYVRNESWADRVLDLWRHAIDE